MRKCFAAYKSVFYELLSFFTWLCLECFGTVTHSQWNTQISFLFLPSLSNFTSSLYLWRLLLLDFFSFVIVFYLFSFLQFSCSVSCHLFISLLFFPFVFVSVVIHSSFMLPFFCPSFADLCCIFLLKYSTAVFPFFLTLSVPHLLSSTSFPSLLLLYLLSYIFFVSLNFPFFARIPLLVIFLPSVVFLSFHLCPQPYPLSPVFPFIFLLTSFLTHVKCSAIWGRSALSFLPPPSLSLLYLSPPLIHPPPPLSLHLSTLSLCGDGFRQASSYQATGYMLIGSVSASLSLSGSCMGLTAVMYCWLLIAWSRGGSAHSHFLFSGWTFAWVPPGEVTSGIAILPCWVDAERLTAAA